MIFPTTAALSGGIFFAMAFPSDVGHWDEVKRLPTFFGRKFIGEELGNQDQ